MNTFYVFLIIEKSQNELCFVICKNCVPLVYQSSLFMFVAVVSSPSSAAVQYCQPLCCLVSCSLPECHPHSSARQVARGCSVAKHLQLVNPDLSGSIVL